ncbi:MAG: hypothetical protein BMS9Abin11_1579 [Gammaproteobacteria bacterium]|nr:MAG: hypothetical protein BMS9Abin11_1579 [Gammaproteobacteria bacterium]
MGRLRIQRANHVNKSLAEQRLIKLEECLKVASSELLDHKRKIERLRGEFNEQSYLVGQQQLIDSMKKRIDELLMEGSKGKLPGLAFGGLEFTVNTITFLSLSPASDRVSIQLAMSAIVPDTASRIDIQNRRFKQVRLIPS